MNSQTRSRMIDDPVVAGDEKQFEDRLVGRARVDSDGLTLVLSGCIVDPQSPDIRAFWRGFIDLQKRLPAAKLVNQIAVHSWNPELAGLVLAVYGPRVARHEYPVVIDADPVRKIESPYRFGFLLKLFGVSSSKGPTLHSVLGEARSRARAVQLLENLPTQCGQVLITRWDLGAIKGVPALPIVADAALPEEYLYLSYSSTVDEGYPDEWMLAPWHVTRHFSRLDVFVLEALTGGNAYLQSLLKTGWPRALRKNRYMRALSRRCDRWRSSLRSQVIQRIEQRLRGSTLPQRVVSRLTAPLRRFLANPPITAENSCVPGLDQMRAVLPMSRALDAQTLLKFFIHSEGLRAQTRFLTQEDFDGTTQAGQLIKPQMIVLIVRETGQVAWSDLLSRSPLPLAAVYQLKSGSVNEFKPNEAGIWSVTALRPTTSSPRDLMACALTAAEGCTAGAQPALLMPSVERYLGCLDWPYLNALMKYVGWAGLSYVELACAVNGRPHLEFPDLHWVQGGGVLALVMAAGTVSGLRRHAEVDDPDTCVRSEPAGESLLELPAVQRGKILFSLAS